MRLSWSAGVGVLAFVRHDQLARVFLFFFWLEPGLSLLGMVPVLLDLLRRDQGVWAADGRRAAGDRQAFKSSLG